MPFFLPYEFGPDSPRPVYEQIQAALAMSLGESGEWEEQRFGGDFIPRVKSPHRWPSTLAQLDSRCGGFTGLTYLVAPPKVGKSILALSSALQAAASMHWRVVYVDAELTRSETGERVDRFIDAHPGAEDALPFLTVIHVSRGVTIESLHEAILSCLELDELRLLVVIDSINRIADLSGREYFRTLSEIGLYLGGARRVSEGTVSGLIVSEVNSRGADKGDKGSYLADMLVRVKPAREPQWVEIDVPHARQGGEGFVGKFLRDWRKGCFVEEERVFNEPLQAVSGEAP